MKNYYEILGLKSGASEDDIKTAYRKLAMEWHPDKHQKDSEEDQKKAEEKFKEISEAYENLKNGVTTDEDPRSKHFSVDDDLAEMMRNFARQAGFRFGFGQPRQEDFYEEIQAPITIKNLYNEEEVEVKVLSFSKEQVVQCPVCGGTGQTTTTQRQGNMIINRSTKCYKCQGQGFTADGVGEEKTFKVKPSIENLQFPLPIGKVGRYNPVTGDYNNVVVRFQLEKLYNYAIVENGMGLMMTLPVTYDVLKDGKKLKVKIFDNNVIVEIPKKPSLQRMLVVPNKGMPLGNGQRGNLYVKLDLKYYD